MGNGDEKWVKLRKTRVRDEGKGGKRGKRGRKERKWATPRENRAKPRENSNTEGKKELKLRENGQH